MDGETKYVYLNAQHSYDMLPSTEHLSVGKLTLCNNGTQTLLGRGGNHIGDYFLYEIDLTGSLLEPEVKTYEDLRIVDLLPDGIRYDSIYLLQGASGLPLLDGGNAYQPEILENYHNSGRTAVIFHLNAENLQRTLATVKLAKVYFWVQIEQSARPGTVRNEVYVVGDNLDEYQGQTGGAADRYDLNNNGETNDKIAYAFSDATIIAAQSMYAEKFIAPDGFLDTHVSAAVTITQNPVTLAYSVTFSKDHTGLGTSADPLCIENHGAYVLPKSGGRGTAAFYIPGAFLFLSAALPDLRKRRSWKR